MYAPNPAIPFSIPGLLPRFLPSLIIAAVAQISALATAEAEAPFPTTELAKLPYLHFSDNNLGEAYLFRMKQETSTIEVGGRRYIGFTFWSTGLVEWLFINTPGGLQPAPWILLNAGGESMHVASPKDIPLKDCPRISARYPQAARVSRYQTEGEALEQRGRYHLVQPVGTSRSAEYALCFTSRSPKSYEAGRSGDLLKRIEHPPLRESSDVVIENMIALRRTEGVQAAMDYLAREMELRIDDDEQSSALPSHHKREAGWSYIALYINAWYEGQTGGGRLDADWAASVYGVMYDVCLRRGYFARTDVALNLTSSLALAGRYGKLTEVFEVWKHGMRMGGYNMNAASYPDLGPAFDILPKVRKRRIPHLTPYADAENQAKPFKDAPHALTDNFIGCFENHALHLWYQGRWQESLEWLAWIRAWASDKETGEPKSPDVGGRWHLSGTEIANQFSSLGFLDHALALHEHALKQKITGGYEGKCTTRHKMGILSLKRRMGRELPTDAIDQARACILQAAGNIYEKQEYVRLYQAELGELLIHVGRIDEGESLLDELSAQGSRDARIARLRYWIKSGRTKGVETEILQLLNESRATGRKMDEMVFYRLYAEFLEREGRIRDALWVRRELVRLCKAFDIFTHLPLEMARLAILLHRLGHHSESLDLARRTRGLLGNGGIPNHMVRSAHVLLESITEGKNNTTPADPLARVEFQPLQSVIIPLKGAPWVSHLTLTNPTDQKKSGSLEANGMPVAFLEVNEDDVDILARIGDGNGAAKLVVPIQPATYKVIALQPAEGFSGEGQITFTWTTDAGNDRTESQVTLEAAAEGITKAIIQAGGYQMNPFYGIPIYHHYVDAGETELSLPMRFVSSQPARVEIYTMDGSPVGIDAQGNGSLLDTGDELFGAGDGKGSLRLPLANSQASFVLRIYPEQALAKDGLSMKIECLDAEKWEIYAEDSIMPIHGK